ncbi:AAA family ATPase [Nocardioides pocheonensis]|uniref:AAA family ATPase n=1 Tax=Nocardioides pocheonensis TaxID=661485 RepID=UPI001C83117D|nr:AAA family ATPase [Nocardioides pocheonensis]
MVPESGAGDALFVLVGGWPASGKTTLSRALARELGTSYLSKDEVKEALMDRLGAPATVAESRRLGAAAVAAVLRVAEGCRGAVVDSTWYPYAAPLARRLPGPIVEVRCRIERAVAQARFAGRVRDSRHLDDLRSEDELWGVEVDPLGLGPLIEVDTGAEVDVPALARAVRAAAERR